MTRVQEQKQRTSADDETEVARALHLSHGFDCPSDHRLIENGENYACCGTCSDSLGIDPCWHLASDLVRWNARLAYVQSREAENVYFRAQNCDESRYSVRALATWALNAARGVTDPVLTLAQRGRLLDAARAVVALAEEVAR